MKKMICMTSLGSVWHQLGSLGVSNNEFVDVLNGLVPSCLPWSHFLKFMRAQFSAICCASVPSIFESLYFTR